MHLNSYLSKYQFEKAFSQLVALIAVVAAINTFLSTTQFGYIHGISSTLNDSYTEIKSIDSHQSDIEKKVKSMENRQAKIEKFVISIEASVTAIDVSTAASNVQLGQILTATTSILAQLDAMVPILQQIEINTAGAVTRSNLLAVLNEEVKEIAFESFDSAAFAGDVCEYDPLGFGPIVCEGAETGLGSVNFVEFLPPI